MIQQILNILWYHINLLILGLTYLMWNFSTINDLFITKKNYFTWNLLEIKLNWKNEPKEQKRSSSGGIQCMCMFYFAVNMVQKVRPLFHHIYKFIFIINLINFTIESNVCYVTNWFNDTFTNLKYKHNWINENWYIWFKF
jgi:hypothetical protein